MAKLVTYRCPECKGEFDFLHHPSDEPPPERCELCHEWMGDQPEVSPVIRLNLGTHKGKTPDALFRRMEAASTARAEQAAEMTGASVEEMGAIKMTNMKDNSRPGDMAVLNNVHQAEKNLSTASARPAMQSFGQPIQQGQQNPQAMAYIQETTAGPNALATRKLMQSMPHQKIIADTTRGGSNGKRY